MVDRVVTGTLTRSEAQVISIHTDSAMFPTVSTVSLFAGEGTTWYADGPGTSAQFNYPNGVAVDSAGNVYVADTSNQRIRKITIVGTTVTVSTLAGNGIVGFLNGPGSSARFNNPSGIAVDSAGNVYVGDTDNHRIRKITTSGTVSTLAGTGTAGFLNGPGSSAKFKYPRGVAVDSAGNVYVADENNHRIRKITIVGTTVTVSTLAGTGTGGFLDGPGSSALFKSPYGVAVDSAGNVYVVDYLNSRIRKIMTSGTTVTVSTLAGNRSAGYADGPGSSAKFRYPTGIAVDSAGYIYVADEDNHSIRKITPGGTVSTIVGSGTAGYAEGTGTNSQFKYPFGVAVDSAGNVYVADSVNNRIRKITTLVVQIQGRQCSCSAGQFWDFATKQCTTQCPVATYADSASKACQPCPANKTSVAGSTNVSQCVCSYASPYWSGISCMQQLNPTAAITVSGSGVTTRYVDKYVIHEFTQSATFFLESPIIANLLLVGGGAGGSSDGKPGLGGNVVTNTLSFNSGDNFYVTVGAGGAADSSGNNTSLWGGGNFLNIATGGSVATGVTSSFNLKYINLTAAFLYCKYCTSDTDCVSGKKCDLTTGTCKNPPVT
jgi:sugar lactone lactonase YvrE